MRQDNKITLADIRNRIARRTKDPNPKGAFDAAFYMWKHYCLRHNIHKMQFFSQTLKKGWLKRTDADHFWWYLFKEEHY